MDQLQISATFPHIASEDLARFEELARECIEIVRAKEPDTLQYDWFFSPDRTRCVVRETHANAAAVMAHMGNLGELIGEVIRLGGGLEIEVFGEPTDELLAAAAAFDPAVYSYFGGS